MLYLSHQDTASFWFLHTLFQYYSVQFKCQPCWHLLLLSCTTRIFLWMGNVSSSNSVTLLKVTIDFNLYNCLYFNVQFLQLNSVEVLGVTHINEGMERGTCVTPIATEMPIQSSLFTQQNMSDGQKLCLHKLDDRRQHFIDWWMRRQLVWSLCALVCPCFVDKKCGFIS